jgi:hypothetical protein
MRVVQSVLRFNIGQSTGRRAGGTTNDASRHFSKRRINQHKILLKKIAPATAKASPQAGRRH